MAGCGEHTWGARAGCLGCRAVKRHYTRRRQQQMAAGTWLPRVPAAEVLEHVTQLRADGMSLTGIARAAGLDKATVIDLPRKQWVTGAVAAEIRAVRAENALPAGFVLPLGAARMVQSLFALGWSFQKQADILGVSNTVLCDLAAHRHRLISESTQTRIRALFEQLSGTPGPSRKSRLLAQRKGWLPPLAWEDVEAGELAEADEETDSAPVDEVAVERVLAGEHLDLTDTELLAAVRIGSARGVSRIQLAALLRVGEFAVKRLLAGEIPHRALAAARTAQASAA